MVYIKKIIIIILFSLVAHFKLNRNCILLVNTSSQIYDESNLRNWIHFQLIEHNEIEESSNSLILSHIIFRHGNRTPDSFEELYPNDPYLNESYYPYGLGQLTNAGKLREYKIGTTLRKRYNSFLSDLALQEEVEAITTDYNRTKASLQLVLAGLFPPKNDLIWNQELLWQPMPYNFLPRDQDKLLMGVTTCPNYVKMYGKVQNSLEMINEYKKFRKVFNYISRFSGLNVTTFQHIYNLYFGLSTQEEYGLILPLWTQIVWPKIITEIAIKEYYVLMRNEEMRKIASGYLLNKIIKDTMDKIRNINSSRRKIYLYSAHENNIAQLLILLDIFDEPHIPNYGAHLILEIHYINAIYGLKVFYQNWDSHQPKLLKIPTCEEFCPIENFIKLFQKYIPEENLCGN